MKQLIMLLIPLLLWAASESTDSLSPRQVQRQERKQARAEKKQKRIDEGKLLVTPYLAPGYTPELGGLLAVGGLFSFKTNPKDSLIQRSSFPVNFSVTSTGGWMSNILMTTFWLEDKLRINGDFWIKDMPDHYWGIGYKNGSTVERTDSTTAYRRQWWWVNPRFLYQPVNNVFAGLSVDYNYTQGRDPSAGVAADPNYQEYNDRPLNSGLGIIARYDSRDIPVDAHSGMLIDLRGTFYGTFMGGDNTYQSILFDYRQFQTVKREGMTFAWQAKGRFTFGEVTYGEMSQLGTPFDLRGYLWGQYRDNHMGFLLVEYRHMFKKMSGELSKHGVVGWVGSGAVFDTDDMKNNTIYSLPNFGIGYRLEVQPRMHLRLDVGIGRETSGFYFNFNQAF